MLQFVHLFVCMQHLSRVLHVAYIAAVNVLIWKQAEMYGTAHCWEHVLDDSCALLTVLKQFI